MTPSVLAIDAGTTGVTGLVVRADGTIGGRGYREFPQHFPAPGHVDHDADEIFAAVVVAGREAIAKAGTMPACIGITNQRETTVVWERATGAPLHRAIVWQDRRTAPRCAALRSASQRSAVRRSCHTIARWMGLPVLRSQMTSVSR